MEYIVFCPLAFLSYAFFRHPLVMLPETCFGLFGLRNRSLGYKARYHNLPNCKRLQGAADARRTGTQTYFLYFKCPTTKQMRCPVNAYWITM